MPHVTIRIFEKTYTAEQKSKAAKGITKELVAALNEDPKHIEIHFMELRKENVAVAGITALEFEASQAKK